MKEDAVILTPNAPSTPRINGARVFGARPGNPFMFAIAATGDRPMRFFANGLPNGLKLDAANGLITGVVNKKGTYNVRLTLENSLGRAERDLRIIIGDKVALTPPMGWNSWNCFAHDVSQDKVESAAHAMVQKGLINHGWTYINIDDYWTVKPGSKDLTLQGRGRDENGRMIPNPRFPDMRGLCNEIHSLGLKAGIYSSPGPLTCGGCLGGYKYELQDAELYAEWGFDYLKYDLCSYDMISKDKSIGELMKPYVSMRDALRVQKRDILYNLCQYGIGNVSTWGDKAGGNSWRTTGDITDTWESVSWLGFSQNGLESYAKPGNWNDPDMLVVGNVGWGPNLHPTRLTPNEQYTHITLWCLLCAPLLVGCDLTRLDDFTLSLLTNDEVLEVNQDPLGQQAARRSQNGDTEVWSKEMEDGSTAAGLFNRGEDKVSVTANWSDLGLKGRKRVRDLWRQQDIGEMDGEYTVGVPRHGAAMVRIFDVD